MGSNKGPDNNPNNPNNPNKDNSAPQTSAGASGESSLQIEQELEELEAQLASSGSPSDSEVEIEEFAEIEKRARRVISTTPLNNATNNVTNNPSNSAQAAQPTQMGLPLPGNPALLPGANVPQSPVAQAQSTTISTDAHHDIKYRLVLVDDAAYSDREPRAGEILIHKNVNNHQLVFKARGVQGQLIEESLAVNSLAANELLDNQKLLQHKEAIQTAFRDRDAEVNQKLVNLKKQTQTAQTAREIAEAENLRLFRNAAELEQAAFDTVLKTRLERSKGMGLNMPTGSDPKHSNAGQVQHLAGLGMESLAIKMNLELLFFFLKLAWARTAGYLLAVRQYNAYAAEYPSSIYNGQELYRYTVDEKGKFKLDRSSVVPKNEVSLADILANGFLPKPSLLSQIKEVSQSYVIDQMGVDIDEELTKAQKFFHGQSLVDKHDDNPDAGDDQEDALLAGRRPLPQPKPTGKT